MSRPNYQAMRLVLLRTFPLSPRMLSWKRCARALPRISATCHPAWPPIYHSVQSSVQQRWKCQGLHRPSSSSLYDKSPRITFVSMFVCFLSPWLTTCSQDGAATNFHSAPRLASNEDLIILRPRMKICTNQGGHKRNCLTFRRSNDCISSA